VLTSPILAGATLAIWLDSGLPILFRQERVGLKFTRFRILKFRSMRVQSAGPLVTVGGDTRITRVGKVLRLTKIDELPQLWNVLLGEMSMVGPRPEVPEYVELFKERYRNILNIRPGVTDFASIYFRNEEEILARSPDPLNDYRSRVLSIKLDLAEKYLREQSLLCDLGIIVRTAVVTLCVNASKKSR